MKLLFLKDKAGGRGVENEKEESPTNYLWLQTTFSCI